jgi:lipoprotein-releasing system permease protein
MAARLMFRERAPRPFVRRLLAGSALVLVIAGAVQLSGASSVAAVALIGVSSLALVAAICMALFTPALGVSVMGIALGCASLMTALAVTTGFERAIVREVTRMNGHVLLTKYGLDFFEYEELADRFARDPRVRAASPFAYSMVAVVRDLEEGTEGETGRPAVVVGKGLDPARAQAMSGVAHVMGRGDLSGLRPGDARHLPGVVPGDRLARELGVGVGDRVRLVLPAEIDGSDDVFGGPPRHAPFEVLDLLHTGVAEFDANLVLMHLTAGQALFFREGRVTGIELELHDPDAAETVAGDLEGELPRMYRTSTWRETNAPTLVSLEQIRFALAVVLGLTVLVAAASLVASLLLIVRSKRSAIATLMALGSDARAVFWVFEVVGLLAGLVGAGLGMLLGGLYCLVIRAHDLPLASDVYPLDHLPVLLRVSDALAPAVIAIALCGMVSGPVALVATRVRIVSGLRR